MMKGFWKNGKWLGLLILALVFAGCAGGGDSSSEPGLANGPGVNGVPITVDPNNHTIAIGDEGAAGHRLDVGGHNVDIQNGSTGCVAGAGSNANCWIKLINRDPSYWMANVYVFGTQCDAQCAGAKIGNADLTHGGALNGTNCGDGSILLNADGEAGCGNPLADIDGLGMCYVEDGEFKATGSPYNTRNCKIHQTIGGDLKPDSILHPQCGQQTVRWNFTGTPSSIYTFIGNVSAQWFPQNPNGDSRMDMQNKGTYYIMVSNMVNNAGIGAQLNGRTWLRPGSYRRSVVTSGYGATGSNTVAPGGYFAVDVALENPDRLEAQQVANTFGNKNYEYYYSFAYVLHYNANVVQLVVGKGGKRTTPGGTIIWAGNDLKDCYKDTLVDYCASGSRQSFLGTSSILPVVGTGWVALIMDLDDGTGGYAFAANQIGAYATFYGGVGNLNLGGFYYYATPSYPVAPKMNGHYGRAHLNVPKGGVRTWNAATNVDGMQTISHIVKQEGIDAAPELPMGMYYFWTKLGTSGKGSEFWLDMKASATYIKTSWTNGSIYPGGVSGISDDWNNVCLPMQAGYLNDAQQGCNPGLPIQSYWVNGGVEVVNTNLGQSGASVTGGIAHFGAVQQWSANICVQ